MREQLLKVEFRNIELEDALSKRDKEALELNLKVRQLIETIESSKSSEGLAKVSELQAEIARER